MAHAARIEDGIVREVIVVPDNLDATESDAAVQAYIHKIGLTGTWIRTSYHGAIRGKFAGVGDTYDATLDEFVTPVNELTVDEQIAELRKQLAALEATR